MAKTISYPDHFVPHGVLTCSTISYLMGDKYVITFRTSRKIYICNTISYVYILHRRFICNAISYITEDLYVIPFRTSPKIYM